MDIIAYTISGGQSSIASRRLCIRRAPVNVTDVVMYNKNDIRYNTLIGSRVHIPQTEVFISLEAAQAIITLMRRDMEAATSIVLRTTFSTKVCIVRVEPAAVTVFEESGCGVVLVMQRQGGHSAKLGWNSGEATASMLIRMQFILPKTNGTSVLRDRIHQHLESATRSGVLEGVTLEGDRCAVMVSYSGKSESEWAYDDEVSIQRTSHMYGQAIEQVLSINCTSARLELVKVTLDISSHVARCRLIDTAWLAYQGRDDATYYDIMAV